MAWRIGESRLRESLVPRTEFIPIADEEFDFVIPTSRRDKASVIKFLNALHNPSVREKLAALGFELHSH